jgi:predicted DNA-binding transcriptional regulator AlpA
MIRDSIDVASPLLTEKEAAAYLRRSPSSLRRARTTGTGPRFVRIGRSVRYLQSELNAYLFTCQTVGKAGVERG